MQDSFRKEMLEKKGWEMRFIACEPRLSEAVEAYKEAGFEVRIEDLPMVPECTACMLKENHDECKACFEDTKEMYKVIFTRPLKNSSSGD